MSITYKFKNDIGNKKLPPQLVTIINFIKEAGTTGIDRDALIAKLTEDNKLNTRQPVERVLSYYHTRMEELDAVTIVKPVKTPAAAKEKGGKKETVVVGAPSAVPEKPETGRAKAVV